MGAIDQAWIQLVAQGVEALVWLGLAMWCLQRMRVDTWARLAGIGAVLMLVPATTLVAARAQILLASDTTILQNYSLGPLPTTYAVMRLVAAGLLLAAVVVGRGSRRATPA